MEQQEPTVLLQLRIDVLREHKRFNEARALCASCLKQSHLAHDAHIHALYIILLAKTNRLQGVLDHVRIITGQVVSPPPYCVCVDNVHVILKN